MPMFEWTQEYSVNVRELDEQHKKLVDMINNLDESMKSENQGDAIKIVLDELLDYTAYHFETEEKLLMQYGYPRLESHTKEHDTLSWRVLDMRTRHESGEGVEAKEIIDFLTTWLKNHILFSDKQYGIFLNSKGLR